MTDDLIARLRNLAEHSNMLFMLQSGNVYLAPLLREAAAALEAAASLPPQTSEKKEDLDSRVDGERLFEGQDLPRSSQRGEPSDDGTRGRQSLLGGRTIVGVALFDDGLGEEWTVLKLDNGVKVQLHNQTPWVVVDPEVM